MTPQVLPTLFSHGRREDFDSETVRFSFVARSSEKIGGANVAITTGPPKFLIPAVDRLGDARVNDGTEMRVVDSQTEG